jgi:hypothetical protein
LRVEEKGCCAERPTPTFNEEENGTKRKASEDGSRREGYLDRE